MKCKYCKKNLNQQDKFNKNEISKDVYEFFHYDCKKPGYDPYQERKK